MSASISGSCRVFGRITHVANTLRATLATRAFITVRSMASAGSGDGGKRKENRLAKERSPYLLQHKDNPVDWYPWSEEAFEKARSQDKPIFLSVGYSTCHWCHVMERESFEDEEVAKLLNEHFVSIKVDREERPDVDRVYMTFVQAMTGHGGWPLNVWLTPELKPFVGATYFPPDDQPGRPGFKTVITHVNRQWGSNKAKLMQQGSVVMDAIKEHTGNMSKGSSSMPGAECVDKLFTDMCSNFDNEMGGIGGAPKFPQAALFNFLLRYSKFKSDESGQKALGMFVKTLECMQKGGIHDHVGQGFHRYSTDQDWHVPHFEKMLYDESQLAVLYTDGYQASKNETLAETVRDILLYVMRDLSHKLGGFYSAEDADSLPTHADTEKKEGAFCVWEEEELKALLDAEKVPTKSGDSIPLSTLFIKYYGVQADGNVKPQQDPHKELRKKNVLIVRESLRDIVKSLDVDESEAKEHLARAREILFEERKTRPAPHLDTKMVTAWNGLMISAFARAAQVLGEDVYLKRAVKAAEFVRKHLLDEKSGKLLRSCYKGEGDEIEQIATPIFGFVDDYGFLVRGLLDLYEASLDEQWLQWAVRTQDKMDELFWDGEAGGYYQAMAGDASILVRMKEAQDGAEPSANSTSVHNLLRLASFTGDKRYRQGAEKILSTFQMLLAKMPLALPEMVSGFTTYLTPSQQIIIAGERDADDTKALLRCVHSHYLPHKTLMLCDGRPDSFLASRLDVFKSLERKDNKATAFVCENYACKLPVNSAVELEKLLAAS